MNDTVNTYFKSWAYDKLTSYSKDLRDGYQLYNQHLQRCIKRFYQHKFLVPENLYTDWNEIYRDHYEEIDMTEEVLKAALIGQDLLNLNACTYEQLCNSVAYSQYPQLGKKIADLIYALTYHKTKNQAKRALPEYIADLKKTPGANYIVLCTMLAEADFIRIMPANNEKLEILREEYRALLTELHCSNYKLMWLELGGLLKDS